jgi:hypothetical protein
MLKKTHQMIKVLLILLIFLNLGSCGDEKVPTIVVDKNDETFSPDKIRPLMDEWQRMTFSYFYEGAEPTIGMTYEGNDRGTTVTTGGSGFGMMALIVGAERGWITREQAADRTVKMLRFLSKAERFKSMWAHWYNTDGTSTPFGNQVKTGDIVESSYVAAGMLTALEYYKGSTAVESEIRQLAESLYNSMDWKSYTNSSNELYWLWYSQENRFDLPVKGWHESWITYVVALGAPDGMNISEEVYKQGWQSNGGIYHPTATYYGYKLPFGETKGGPMFYAHYTFLGLNPFLIEDQYANYGQQNVAHAMINRHYCVAEAPAAHKYDERNWGLTACYGGKPPWNYSARSPTNDDGVLAPTAALGNFAYTPFYSTQVLLNLSTMPLVHGAYGFADSYSPSTNTSEKRHLAIDQGPIVIMMENYRSGLIWNLLMKNERIKLGLKRAGVKDKPVYKEGFHLAMVNTQTNEYDMMRHPDRKLYELGFYAEKAGNYKFTITNIAQNKLVLEKTIEVVLGENIFSFDAEEIQKGKQHTIKMLNSENKAYSILTRLR